MQDRTVLLIDSDSDSLRIYTLILEHHGFRVLCAREGGQGFRLAREQQPDLLIVEPFEPASRSARVVDALRADASTAHLPVLVITAAPGLLRGQRHLTKPCQPMRVLEEVQRLLGMAVPAELN